jgi:hypothetical protein
MADKTFAYFRKIVLTTEIRTSDGKPIAWENAGWQTGVLKTSDAKLISELTQFATSQRGGVTVIDEATYEDLKKNSGQKSPRQQPVMARASIPQPSTPPQSPKEQSAKSSSSAAAGKKPAVERTEKPATATGVFPPDAPSV